MSDGGRTALSGYLWQAIAVVGLAARALIVQDPNNETHELDVLVEFIAQGGSILHEYFDQDAFITLGEAGLDQQDQGVLVQFKFSRQDPPPSLSQTDLSEIVAKLKQSAESAQRAGKSITGYALITNRHVASEERASEQESGQAPPPVFIKDLDGISLRIVTRIDSDIWRSWIERVGHAYGCTDSEIRNGVYKLLGQLFDATQSQIDMPLQQGAVLEALTGLPKARMFTAKAINSWDQPNFEDLRRGMGLYGQPVRRSVLDELDHRVRESAVIAVIGSGGLGKTVAVSQWLQEYRDSGRAVALLRQSTDAMSEHYLAREARRWATDSTTAPSRTMDTLPDILKRLKIANPDTRPLLFLLGLDGMDDAILQAHVDYIRMVFKAFSDEGKRAASIHSQPLAALVVTCRDDSELKQYLPIRDMSGFGIPTDEQCAIVRVEPFSWSELQVAAHQLPDALQLLVDAAIGQARQVEDFGASAAGDARTTDQNEALAVALFPETANHSSTLPNLGTSRLLAGDGMKEHPIGLLRHPVLWRAFLHLPSAQQEAMLQGEANALMQLAQQYVARLCAKAQERHAELRRAPIAEALGAVAQFCLASGKTIFDRVSFYDQVRASGVVSSHGERLLFEEALSCGVIETQSRFRWSWTHPFICSYLADYGCDELPPP